MRFRIYTLLSKIYDGYKECDSKEEPLPERPLFTVNNDLILGEGCFGVVYEVELDNQRKAAKFFFEPKNKIYEEMIYSELIKNEVKCVPNKHSSGYNYIVMDLIVGDTMDIFLKKQENKKILKYTNLKLNPEIDSPIILDNESTKYQELIHTVEDDHEITQKIVFTKVFEAYFELHKYGIIHADIRPQNIMVDNDLNVKLIDFGFSWPDTDYCIDFSRLIIRIINNLDVDKISKYFEYIQKNIKNKEAFKIFLEFYNDKDIKWLYNRTQAFNDPSKEYWAQIILRKIFSGLDGKIADINRRYFESLNEDII